jgi:hypothetical protein
MIKKFTTSIFFLLISVIAFAQNGNNSRPYKLTIVDANNEADTVVRKKLTDAFFAVYPDFARADGYRTKREATLTISNDLSTNMTAEAGKIVVNSAWLKKNDNKLEKELRYQLSRRWVSADTMKKKGYQLVFISKDPNFDQTTKQNLINTYFKVYPKLVKTFNKTSTRNVLFVVDTAYKGVAEASGGRILFSSAYMKTHPTDIDVVTHETMHIVQGYGYSAGPVWLTEGIADFIRYKYGVDNIGSKWSLPAYTEKQNYKNSYRITARFFVWLEKNVKPNLITTLDTELRAHTYSEKSWENLTGKTIDELWADYGKNPDVELAYSGK